MARSSRRLTSVAVLSGCAALVSACADHDGNDLASEKSPASVTHGALIARGERGVNYADENTPELRAWGPSSLRADRDGTFWIADVAAHRLLHVDEQGKFLGALALPEEVQSAVDFEISEDGFEVLDLASDGTEVVRLARDGKLRERQVLPDQLGMEATGLLKSGGEVMLHLGDAHVAKLRGGAGQKALSLPQAVDLHLNERAVQIVAERAVPGQDSALRSAVFKLGDRDLRIDAKAWLGTVRVAHTFEDGGVLLTVEDVNFGPELQVDMSIWRVDDKGHVLGKANVPTDEQYTYVEHAIAVQPDGDVFALVTRPDGAELRQLPFSQNYEPAVDAVDPSLLRRVTSVQKACTVTPEQARQVASDYVNNKTALSVTNLTGACDGRQRPRYLGTTAGTYNSVPYDWGGFDSVANYNSYMTMGKQAGDIDTATIEACSKGVDCSGFVSRAWGRTTRLTTTTIPNYTCQLSSQAVLKLGDVMNKAGSHVAMFAAQASATEAYWYEATKSDSVDRVVYWKKPYTRFTGYQPRRYLDMCGAVCE